MRNITSCILLITAIIILFFTTSCEKENNKCEQVSFLKSSIIYPEFDAIGQLHNFCLKIIHDDKDFLSIYDNTDYIDSLIFTKTGIKTDTTYDPYFVLNYVDNILYYADSLKKINIISSFEYKFYVFLDSISKIPKITNSEFDIIINKYIKESIDTSRLNTKEEINILGTLYVLSHSNNYWYVNSQNTITSKWINQDYFYKIYAAYQFYNNKEYYKMQNIVIGVAVADALGFSECVNYYDNEDPTIFGPHEYHDGRERAVYLACGAEACLASKAYIISNL